MNCITPTTPLESGRDITEVELLATCLATSLPIYIILTYASTDRDILSF